MADDQNPSDPQVPVSTTADQSPNSDTNRLESTIMADSTDTSSVPEQSASTNNQSEPSVSADSDSSNLADSQPTTVTSTPSPVEEPPQSTTPLTSETSPSEQTSTPPPIISVPNLDTPSDLNNPSPIFVSPPDNQVPQVQSDVPNNTPTITQSQRQLNRPISNQSLLKAHKTLHWPIQYLQILPPQALGNYFLAIPILRHLLHLLLLLT